MERKEVRQAARGREREREGRGKVRSERGTESEGRTINLQDLMLHCQVQFPAL